MIAGLRKNVDQLRTELIVRTKLYNQLSVRLTPLSYVGQQLQRPKATGGSRIRGSVS